MPPDKRSKSAAAPKGALKGHSSRHSSSSNHATFGATTLRLEGKHPDGRPVHLIGHSCLKVWGVYCLGALSATVYTACVYGTVLLMTRCRCTARSALPVWAGFGLVFLSAWMALRGSRRPLNGFTHFHTHRTVKRSVTLALRCGSR